MDIPAYGAYSAKMGRVGWIPRLSVKKLNLSYYVGESIRITIHTHCGNLISIPQQQPR